MRNVASSLLVAWVAVSLVSPARADSKEVPTAPPTPVVQADSQTEAQKAYGVLEETPNQRRIRLGQPIVASFPPPDYGELLETPNHRRARLAAETQTASRQ